MLVFGRVLVLASSTLKVFPTLKCEPMIQVLFYCHVYSNVRGDF